MIRVTYALKHTNHIFLSKECHYFSRGITLSPWFIFIMIQIPEMKEIEYLYTKIEELNERTKKHTKQIKELQKQINQKGSDGK